MRDCVPGFHKNGGIRLEVVLEVLEEVLAHLVDSILLEALKSLWKLLQGIQLRLEVVVGFVKVDVVRAQRDADVFPLQIRVVNY